MAASKVDASRESLCKYKLSWGTPGDLVGGASGFISGLIVYSTAPVSEATKVGLGTLSTLVSTLALRPVVKHIERRADRIPVSVSLQGRAQSANVASQISQSKNLFGRGVKVCLSPFKQNDRK
jgi:hypothetical protein